MTKFVSASIACLFLPQWTAASVMENYDLFSSRFQIVSPERLKMDLDHRDALFGRSPFGLTIEKDIFYTTRSLCEDGEWPGTPDFIEAEGYILMVDRGGCSFVTKVRNAQMANATAVVIADDRCMCSAGPSCVSDKPCEKFEPVMDDDDSGSDITVPSMLLAKPDADTLKNEMMAGTLIDIKLSWPIPKSYDGVAHYTLWTSPNDWMSKMLVKTFKFAAVSLGHMARFKPRMYIMDGIALGCRDGQDCTGRCTNGGRYCAPSDYDADELNNENLGVKMVLESLRRSCIWNIYGEIDGTGEQWWDYVSQWLVKCSDSNYSTTCAETVFAKAGVDANLVNQCIDASGGFRDDVENTILEDLLRSAEEDKIIFAPSLFINGADLRGELNFGSVLNAICLTFEQSDRPGVCANWNVCESLCPSGHQCILKDDECIEYISIDSTQTETYDDDVLNPEPVATTSGATASATTTTTAASASTNATTTTTASVSTSTTTTTTATTSTTTAVVPTVSPTAAPVELEKKPETNEKEVKAGEHNGESSVSETIQIYEGSGHSSGMEAAAFIIGIGAGLGCFCVFGLGFCIALRVLRRRRAPRRGDRKALVDPVADMLDGDEYEYADDDYDDE